MTIRKNARRLGNATVLATLYQIAVVYSGAMVDSLRVTGM